MGSNHSHHPGGPASPRAVRSALAVLVVAGLVTLLGVVLLWPGERPQPANTGEAAVVTQVHGEVVAVDRTVCPDTAAAVAEPGCGVRVRLSDGPDASTVVLTDIPSGPGAPTVTTGDAVVLQYVPDQGNGKPYQITDHQRGNQLWLLVAAFVLAVLAFGRWRGLTALAGLGVTFAVLLVFMLPAILAGESPLLVAIVGSAAIMLSVLYLTHGLTVPTSVAVIGTLTSLTLTGLLAAAFTSLTRLTGIASEEAGLISVTHTGVDMRGLLLAGVLIGSLGVLDDIAVTQAATVTELAAANPASTPRELYRAASRIGRAHIASVINTIILAYAGASLPLLLLLVAGNTPTGQMLTNELLAQEIVRSGVGTIGLIACVPITTALAAVTAGGRFELLRPRRPRGRHAGLG